MSNQKQNDPLKIDSGGIRIGLREAIEYSPYVLCSGCHQGIREKNMIGDLCERCHYAKEVNEEDEKLKAEGSPVHGKKDGRKKFGAAPAGQLSLSI